MALCILTVVMLFPGINRFGQHTIGVTIDVIMSWLGVVSVLLLVGYATQSLRQFDREMLVSWVIVTPAVHCALIHVGNRLFARGLNRPESRRPAVIVGAGPTGLRVAETLQSHQEPGRDFLGFFDDRSPERVQLPPQARMCGTLSHLPAFIDANGVKDVFITLPLTSQPRILHLMETLQNTTASLHFVPDIFGITIIQGRLEDMGGMPVVGLTMTPFTGVNGLIKRLSDLVLASLILVLISPLLLILAVGVKLSSPGPVLFKQNRTGLDGEIIRVYKFRSMTTMENGERVIQVKRGDERVTRFGAFMRRTSLDELPQFFNVLQGRMSIVGPRPHAVAHNTEYRALVKAYMARHKVKPGITGWAQVNGLRGETDTLEKMALRVEYDLEYLRNWSLSLDLKIIARTARLVLFDRKAY